MNIIWVHPLFHYSFQHKHDGESWRQWHEVRISVGFLLIWVPPSQSLFQHRDLLHLSMCITCRCECRCYLLWSVICTIRCKLRSLLVKILTLSSNILTQIYLNHLYLIFVSMQYFSNLPKFFFLCHISERRCRKAATVQFNNIVMLSMLIVIERN